MVSGILCDFFPFASLMIIFSAFFPPPPNIGFFRLRKKWIPAYCAELIASLFFLSLFGVARSDIS